MAPRQPIVGSIDVGNGVQMYYEELGNGPVLLLVHGLWGSCRFFRRQLESLSAHYRVIAVDLRGHGRSSMTLSGLTVPTYARDLRAFIERLGLESFVAVGWSMGVFAWWEYYREFNLGGVRGLVVIDQPPSDWQSPLIPAALISFESLRDWHRRILTDRNAFMREVVPMMFAQPPAAEDFAWMFDEMTRAPEAVAAAVLVDQTLREYQDALWGYPIPTLVCNGRHSPQPRVAFDLILERVKSARLVTFESSGHCLFIEEASLFNEHVHRFAWPLLNRQG
jgi:non-heme chloroperoxidase